MILAGIDENNYWRGNWREYAQGEEVPEEGNWVAIESIPTDTRNMQERRCYKYDEESATFVLDEDKYAIVANKAANKAALHEIRLLEDKLQASDHRIIKCYEYSLVGKELPYDIVELNAERDKFRDRINEIQATLN